MGPRPAEERLAEEGGEDVREAPEVGVHWREPAATEPRVPEAVVCAAPLGVGQHLVRLGDGPELQLGVRLLAHIGMVLAGESAEGTLDFLVARAAGDPEELVVVLLGRRHQTVPYTSSTKRESSNAAARTARIALS